MKYSVHLLSVDFWKTGRIIVRSLSSVHIVHISCSFGMEFSMYLVRSSLVESHMISWNGVFFGWKRKNSMFQSLIAADERSALKELSVWNCQHLLGESWCQLPILQWAVSVNKFSYYIFTDLQTQKYIRCSTNANGVYFSNLKYNVKIQRQNVGSLRECGESSWCSKTDVYLEATPTPTVLIWIFCVTEMLSCILLVFILHCHQIFKMKIPRTGCPF